MRNDCLSGFRHRNSSMAPMHKKLNKKMQEAKKNQKKDENKQLLSQRIQLPRIKQLPRELLPILGKSSLKSSIDNNMFEFRNVQDILPSLSFITDSEDQILQSSLEFFTISGEPEGYFINTNSKLRDVSGVFDIPMFVKRVHLVEPIPTMEGSYILPSDGSLPQNREKWINTFTKIHDPYNEAYVDTLCSAVMSRLVETKKSPHWCKFYGTFNSRVNKYLYNITGEISSLKQERWFNKNQRAGLFKLKVVGENSDNKPLVEIIEEGGPIECDFLSNDLEMNDSTNNSDDDDDIIQIDGSLESSNSDSESDILSESPLTDDDKSVEILEERPVRIIPIEKSESDSESEENDSDDYEDSDESNELSDLSIDSEYDDNHNQCEFFAEFNDFPVQVTMIERCKGTMDALLDIEEDNNGDDEMTNTKDARWSAWIYQVIAGLSVAQYYYGFVHNDLHTNNVMWVPTEEEFIYYKLDGLKEGPKFYKVPTYGKLMKIIDFGRASFWLKDRNSLIITDSFADGNDAANQYNCPPYYDSSEPKVNPNPSFDLCRLAVSMFDALYPEQPEVKENSKKITEEDGRIMFETESKLFNLLWLWLTDSEGRNILRNVDDSERFPDFELYKHIARYANNCIPREQATIAYFDSLYKIDEKTVPDNTKVWDLPLN